MVANNTNSRAAVEIASKYQDRPFLILAKETTHAKSGKANG